MESWFSSPKCFDHLWICTTKAGGTDAQQKRDAKVGTFQETKMGGKLQHRGIISWL
jgi:hypothetical protein